MLTSFASLFAIRVRQLATDALGRPQTWSNTKPIATFLFSIYHNGIGAVVAGGRR